jgi:hypothetical protein
MLQSVIGLVILAIAMTPGVPGEVFYSKITGRDWRKNRLYHITRVVLISILGLVVYTLIAHSLGWSFPLYVMPSSFQRELTESTVATMALAYLGHLTCASAIGGLCGVIYKKLTEVAGGTIEPFAWDDLTNTHVQGRWVVVDLVGDKAYAGIIETADDYVPADQRDVLLKEPALYRDGEKGEGYYTMEYQHLFLSASLIESVAVVHEEGDDRISDIGEKIL